MIGFMTDLCVLNKSCNMDGRIRESTHCNDSAQRIQWLTYLQHLHKGGEVKYLIAVISVCEE